MNKNIPSIAVLLTCHNRKDKTLQCLEALHLQNGCKANFVFEVFLVDDGSTDGTAEAVSVKFPKVKIIAGNGNLYWNQGMRLAWKTAVETKDYDFYFWLNDDTILDSNALLNLFETYKQVKVVEQKEIIITAACRTALGNNVFSYGGRSETGPVMPNGNPQTCKYINGNAVLVSKGIYKKLGNLSKVYTHGMGDFDYGLRTLEAGFECYTTSDFVATCALNEGIPGWCNSEIPLKIRWKLFHSPRGLNIREYIQFRRKFWGLKWIIYALKAYLKMISPKLYKKLS